MKTNPKIAGLILFAFFAIVCPSIATAQEVDDPRGMTPLFYVNGYVLLNNGDTLTGKIKCSFKYVENNPVEIKFKQVTGAPVTYTASTIRGFGYYYPENTYEEPILENYVSMPSLKKGIPVFMNRLLDGIITVYQNRSSVSFNTSRVVEDSKIDGITFSFSPGEGLTIGPSYHTSYRIIKGRTWYTSYIVSKNNEPLIKVQKENYESLFPVLFGDCELMKQELEANPQLHKFNNFMILVEVYNRICSNSRLQ